LSEKIMVLSLGKTQNTIILIAKILYQKNHN